MNTLGFLAQHLVVLLDPARIVGNLHHAYRERAQFDARYGVFMTGPSATADIEGVLIHGAQGIRTLTVVPVARAAEIARPATCAHATVGIFATGDRHVAAQNC